MGEHPILPTIHYCLALRPARIRHRDISLFFQLSIIVLGVTEEKTLPNLIWT